MSYQITRHIYGLIDPRTNAIHYVGASVMPVFRLHQHISHSKNPKTPTSTGAWICELTTLGMRPEVVILETITSWCRDHIDAAEGEWIWHLRDSGSPLLNKYPVARHWYHQGKSAVLKQKLVENSSIKVLTRPE